MSFSDIEDTDARFSDLLSDFPLIPDLTPEDFPVAFTYPPLHPSSALSSDAEPELDPILASFARSKALQRRRLTVAAGKQQMLGEVGRAVSPISSDEGIPDYVDNSSSPPNPIDIDLVHPALASGDEMAVSSDDGHRPIPIDFSQLGGSDLDSPDRRWMPCMSSLQTFFLTP